MIPAFFPLFKIECRVSPALKANLSLSDATRAQTTLTESQAGLTVPLILEGALIISQIVVRTIAFDKVSQA